MKGYLGTTCHFIDDDWSLQSVMLQCNRFYGQHTADNITQQYHETVDHYNLAEKISNIVTDSASNMLKAFRLPGFQLEEDSSEADSDADDEDIVDIIDLEGSMTYLPQHDPCFSHTLQLMVKDGFKNSRGINKVLAKAANIVSYVRKSTKASEILEGERRLQAKVATRWNSELKSIKSLLSMPTDKLQQLECQQLNSYERAILQDLVETLSPFKEATDATQGQNIVTASFVIPCIRGLHASLNSLQSKYNCPMVADLLASLNRRMSQYEDKDRFMFAAVLDPRFKLQWCGSDDEKAIIKKKFTELVSKSTVQSANTSPTEAEETGPPKEKKRKLFSSMSTSSLIPTN